MHSNNERPAFNTSAAAGFNAPTLPQSVNSGNERPRRYDPASARNGASYPVPAFHESRWQPGSRYLV
ncbi:MAG: hypothetical protein EOO08_11730 [Chitinophagaceae bacterium]|nr:MAG: hypothetical protein EOO08_11730 [Chitinophagaceae bacterium]